MHDLDIRLLNEDSKNMREVAIIGIGQIPVGEHWDSSLRMLAADAIQKALKSLRPTELKGNQARHLDTLAMIIVWTL